MFLAATIVSILLTFLLVQSALLKFRRTGGAITHIHEAAGVPTSWFPWLGTAEITGGVGLLIGLDFGPIGIAAGIGLVLYFVGAVGAHLRRRDFSPAVVTASFFLLFSGLALGLEIAIL